MKRFFIYALLFILSLNVTTLKADTEVEGTPTQQDYTSSHQSGWVISPANACDIINVYPRTQNGITGSTYDVENRLQCTKPNENYLFVSGSEIKTSTLISCSQTFNSDGNYNLANYSLQHKFSVQCFYRCNQKTNEQCQTEMNDPDAYFDNSSCSCKIPCTPPEDKEFIKSFDSQTECQEALPSFSDAYEELQCHGCLDSMNNWNGGLYGNRIACPNDNFYFDTELHQCLCPTHVTRTCESGMYWDNDECMCLLNQTCEELAQDAAASCNQEVNDLFFECTTDISGYEVLVTRNDCIPKIPTCEDLRSQALASCPEEYNDFYFECTLDAFSHEPLVTRNECIPNGENPDYPSDCNATQTYNYDTQKCENNPENPNPENPDDEGTTTPDNNITKPTDTNNTTNGILEGIRSDLNTTNSILDQILQAIRSDLNASNDTNTSAPPGTPGTDPEEEDDNKTEDQNGTKEGWDEDELKDAILNQFAKRYTIFNTDCGSPAFDPGVTFMGISVENPLPIMHEKISPYLEQIRILVILSATLLGVLSLFRR
jgi:hypothetical protein